MPKLTVNHSPALEELLRAGDAPVDGIEVGPWMDPERIRALHADLPDLPIQFHAGGMLVRNRGRAGLLERFAEYHACTQSAWVSLHIELLPNWVFRLGTRLNLYLPPPPIERARSTFLHEMQDAREMVHLPFLLENMSSLNREKYAFATDPALIGELITSTDAGLLFDIAHARLAASYRGMAVEEYINALPLERVRQVHVSGPRTKNGALYDAHESMQDEDYALLEWVLGRCTPEVVTLEYHRQREPLREQLHRLREMIGG